MGDPCQITYGSRLWKWPRLGSGPASSHDSSASLTAASPKSWIGTRKRDPSDPALLGAASQELQRPTWRNELRTIGRRIQACFHGKLETGMMVLGLSEGFFLPFHFFPLFPSIKPTRTSYSNYISILKRKGQKSVINPFVGIERPGWFCQYECRIEKGLY